MHRPSESKWWISCTELVIHHRGSPPPEEAYRKPEPVLLWLMFRLMHLQDYLFWSCHLFVIAAAGFLRLDHGLYFHTKSLWEIFDFALRGIKSSSRITHILLHCKAALRTTVSCCYFLINLTYFPSRQKFSYMPNVADKLYCLNADWIHLFHSKDEHLNRQWGFL